MRRLRPGRAQRWPLPAARLCVDRPTAWPGRTGVARRQGMCGSARGRARRPADERLSSHCRGKSAALARGCQLPGRHGQGRVRRHGVDRPRQPRRRRGALRLQPGRPRALGLGLRLVPGPALPRRADVCKAVASGGRAAGGRGHPVDLQPNLAAQPSVAGRAQAPERAARRHGPVPDAGAAAAGRVLTRALRAFVDQQHQPPGGVDAGTPAGRRALRHILPRTRRRAVG